MSSVPPMTFGSLFAGIGGFDLGFERAGLVCKWQVEIDPFCRRVLEKHWPEVTRYGDVRDFSPDSACCAPVDIVCGGDPCQENSGARVTTGTSHPSLGAEFIRVVSVLRPQFVVRENPSSVRRDAPWPWWRFCDELASIGYKVRPIKIRACCFGYPHRRERMFVCARRSDSDCQSIRLPECREDVRTAGALQEEARQRKRLRVDAGSVVRREQSQSDAGLVGISDGVPSGLDKSKRCRALGNAVIPDMSEWIVRRMAGDLDYV